MDATNTGTAPIYDLLITERGDVSVRTTSRTACTRPPALVTSKLPCQSPGARPLDDSVLSSS
ncbi:hypothetical protein OG215_31270 [Streptomyces globisporus]|uniref:hypothetical protein n=1 Tax=Streptomyces globisporus TaxID=1908 RepID=UPI00386C18F8|nr:hypothetical protein OG215_31270 [Streptomyces globisporus]